MNLLGDARIGDYVLIKTIGTGTTGKVKLAQRVNTNEYVAIKVVKKEKVEVGYDIEQKVHREIALMRLFDHPHILKLIEVLESKRHIFLVLEYAEKGELFDYLVQSGTLREDVAIDIFRQIIFGLSYLHAHSICHRDLKPENILMDKFGRIKIADFGFARWMPSHIAETSCGSPHYAAPEVIRGGSYAGRPADIWSAGVILYALLAGYLPFDDPSIRVLLEKVKKGRFVMPDFPEDLKDLIGQMIRVDPNARITIDKIIAHPAFRFTLPTRYVVPMPVPYANTGETINTKMLSDVVKTCLERIGVSADELEKAMKMPETNMVKVFALILSRQVGMEDIPWDQAVTTMEDLPMPSDESFGTDTICPKPAIVTKSRFDESESMSDGFSLAHERSWIDEIATNGESDFEDIETFPAVNMPLAYMMTVIQIALVETGFAFFHPSDLQLIGRNEDTLVQIDAWFTNEQENMIAFKVQVKNGGLTAKNDLCTEIRKNIEEFMC